MNILEEIVKNTVLRVENLKKEKPLNALIDEVMAQPKRENRFFEALSGDEISFICEVKKASPSKGLISEDFNYIQIAKDYQNAGASAISVLTEPKWFLGKNEYLTEISKNVSIPLLRKDFTVDKYQIYEAKIIGASAILLIVSVLDDKKLADFIETAHSVGLFALVEAHDKDEIDRAVRAGAKIIGVNNRNLKDFTVNIENSIYLRQFVPDEIIYVSESGIKTADDVAKLRQNKVNAVLIGETFMRSNNKKAQLKRLRGGK